MFNQFNNPGALILIAFFYFTLIFLFLRVVKWKKKTRKIFKANLLNFTANSYFGLKFYICLISLTLLLVAAANPGKKDNKNTPVNKGVDVIFAVDVSKSMLTEDIGMSRLSATINLLKIVVSSMPNNRYGLVTFAGNSYLQVPLTTDLGAFSMTISNLGTDLAPKPGTSISEAISLSAKALHTGERYQKAIIIISDGENHTGNPLDAAKSASDSGVIIFTIGVGSTKGGPVKDEETGAYKKDAAGAIIISRLNETLLSDIARVSKGKYYSYTSSEQVLNLIKKDINDLRKTALGHNGISGFRSFYWIFLLIGLIMITAEVFIPETTRQKKSP